MGIDETERVHAANLEKVDHVVVVMLENRSFDHMLGYLSLTGRRPDIDGLRPGLANQYQGRTYPVHHLAATALEMDPDHSASAIDQQVAGGNMSGFVASAAATLAGRGVEDGDPGCVMGYYDGADVPVYDHLAEEFAVCDRWFSSVPGATLPNRLYALCGVAAGSRDDRPPACAAPVPPALLRPAPRRPPTSPGAGIPSTPGRCAWPMPTTCWGTITGSATSARPACRGRPFSTSAATRRSPASSKTPRPGRCGRCRGSTRRSPTSTRSASPSTTTIRRPTSKTARTWCWPSTTRWPQARSGTARCWSSSTTNTAASTITSRRRRPRTMSPQMFGRYGVRVPAIIVSPWIEPRTVSHTLFDHTSIIKTILLRFCPQALRSSRSRPRKAAARLGLGPQYPGLRVAQASHLGELLTRTTPRAAPPRDALLRQAAARAARAGTSQPRPGPRGDHPLNDLQKSILAATQS